MHLLFRIFINFFLFLFIPFQFRFVLLWICRTFRLPKNLLMIFLIGNKNTEINVKKIEENISPLKSYSLHPQLPCSRTQMYTYMYTDLYLYIVFCMHSQSYTCSFSIYLYIFFCRHFYRIFTSNQLLTTCNSVCFFFFYSSFAIVLFPLRFFLWDFYLFAWLSCCYFYCSCCCC